jgi:hypothetical protein
MELNVLTTANPTAWAHALDRTGWHDFYHEAWYHELAEQRGEGRAELLVASHQGATLALPLLFRPIGAELGAGDAELCDATSVYGYAGPAGVLERLDESTSSAMLAEITAYLRSRNTVSVFSRLHTLRDQAAALRGAGEVTHAGTTVSVDLRLAPDQQWADYRADNRNRIRRLEREGYVCQRRAPEDIDVFMSIYEGTMKRLSAKSYYLFGREYYEALVDPARGGLELLVVCDGEGTPAAAGLFSYRCGVVQYHLSGAHENYRKQAPTTMMLDHVRRSAIDRGCDRFHLGGGLGGSEDSLFAFKSGFGTGRHAFRVWSWVLDASVYRDLEARRAKHQPPAPASFFPAYRAP